MRTALAASATSIVLLLLSSPVLARADDATTIKAFLAANLDLDKQPAGVVVGYVDEQGSWIVSHGRVNGRDMDGDTVFEIGSITKTFTALLLLEMAARGEVQMDDPVAKHLPESVKSPSRGGKEITLLNLAAQDSGLPFNADNHVGGDWEARFEGYTRARMYAYLARHRLAVEPGEAFQYSNIGMALLGHVMERRTGKTLDTLFAERICEPLGMDSTRIVLTPELKQRFVPGYDKDDKPAASWELTDFAGAGGLRSTANDLLKYCRAHLGLTAPTKLTPLIEQTHVIRHRGDSEFGNTAMPWMDDAIIQPAGSLILEHAGGTGGYSAFVGFDLKRRRGFVVLANQAGKFSSRALGCRLIQGAPLNGQKLVGIEPMREHVGIGAALEVDPKSNAVRIRKVLDNSPAARAGLSAGWVIVAIDEVSTAGKSPQDCAALIRGERGRRVRLELNNPANQESLTVDITRGTFRSGEG